MRGHSVVLGGLGGDSHSVGVNILRYALASRGYQVVYLGIQNSLESFVQLGSMANVVMMSNMDGHAAHYLREFPEMRRLHGGTKALWYLGGNLTIDHGVGLERVFMDMGFHRVFVKFADVTTVLRVLDEDLDRVEPRRIPEVLLPEARSSLKNATPPEDRKWDWDELLEDRPNVLDHWRTGREAADLRDNANFLAKGKNTLAAAQGRVDQKRLRPLVQPRCGVALVEQQLRLFQALQAGGADVLSYQVDSLTRNNNYSGVEEEIRTSRIEKRSTLNGFPVVNHGVSRIRQISQAIDVPMQVRHSTRDPRLLAEISLAGGVAGYEGGSICYNIPYYKEYPLTESIPRWQYVDRLCGHYREEYNLVVDREFFGVLTATLIPPSIAISICILEALLAARQGVRSVSLGYAEQGNRAQDIAAIRMIRILGRKFLDAFGYTEAAVHAIFHQYMAAFPQTSERAEQLILHSGESAALSGATRLLTKTPVEAVKVPSTEDNLQGLQLSRLGFALAEDQTTQEAAIERECRIIEDEVTSIMDSVLMLGKGDLARAVVEAFDLGKLDVPFSPSNYCRGEVVTVRDVNGAVRFASPGQLALSGDLRAFHRDSVSERRIRDGIRSSEEDFLLVERDVLRIARGQYRSWPLED